MTVGTMLLGLVPLLWADGTGADVMKRIAAPMVGGLLTSAFLTLEIIPVIYTYWRLEQLLQQRLLTIDPRRRRRLRAAGWTVAAGALAIALVPVVPIYDGRLGLTAPAALLDALLVGGVVAMGLGLASYLALRPAGYRAVWPATTAAS
jgi:copper/silver efflux system protein